MTAKISSKISPKRTALLAAARERILVLDGAMGTMIQGLQYDEAAFRGAAFCRLPSRCPRQQRPVDPDAAEGDRGHPRRLPARRRRHRRHQHVLLDLDRAGRLRHVGPRLRTQPRRREARPRRRRARQRRGRQTAFRRRRAGPDQPDRFDLARRFQPRLSRRHLRRSAQVLWRTDQRPARRRRRPAAGRNHLRHAERQGRALRDFGNHRRTRHRRARDDLGHHHRQVRPAAVGAIAGSVLEFGAARQADHHRLQLRARRRRPARPHRRHRPRRRYAGLRLSERRPAQRVRPVRRDARNTWRG